jgi:lipopolysaccharide export LptBFGC system permease protein LptF
MTSALMVGILFSLASSYAFHYVIPWAHFYKYRVVASELRAVILNTGLGDDNIRLQGRISMTWERDLGQGRFEDVYINVLKEAEEGDSVGGGVLGRKGIYRAKSASLLADLEQENLTLRIEELYDPVSGAQLGELSLSVNLRTIVEGRGRRRESERDMTSVQLLSEVNLGIHDSPGGAEYTVHRRGCFALMPFLFAPLGFCIGVLARDRGRVFALVLSMAPLMVFYLTDLLGAEILQAIDVPMLGWLPALVVFLLGLPFCWRLLRY